ncbi:Rne/Rng family ribonuclease [Pukyongiella litopenaei]|uniref:Ribonuclease E n=1 Tax=Pukyongiella litopenaei TaxID=2605946 RepID=A0A2S0ML06_9RHOB|nr:Rne/Rng family ribonuclease [Pukyongiella litopenaei]AVO36564.1 Rne/Rng family ribonuclease [Pukyongiella litopenaei]
MAKKMLIDATHAEETRVVVVDGNKVEEFDFESENKRQLAGNIYLAKVTRVEPSLQAAFVDYGGNRHGFLAFSEIHPDYYQIPVADREALMEEERAYAEAMKARDEEDAVKPKSSRSRRSRSKAAAIKSDDAVETREITGMETIDLSDEDGAEETGVAGFGQGADATVEGSDEGTIAAEAGQSDEAAETASAEDGADATDDTAEAKAGDAPADDAQSDDVQPDEAADTEQPGAGDVVDAAEGAENGAGDGKDTGHPDAAEKDANIESIARDDDAEDLRPPRKPRSRRYKIQEVIKVRQILLVQVVKEERGNKGAALTTYLSLAGRYCVLMPNTARGGGISRKITNAADRKKLKEIAGGIDVPQGAGLIIRTAGAKRTKSEIKRDYEYLQRLWEQIRELTLKSIAPAKIYEEGDLIKRSIRDLYSRDIDEVLVEGERGYRSAKDFMKMIMPSHAKNVKRYEDALPLFARFQVESYLNAMFNPTVQLKSGGYIVIGVTEALVAIDVNSGRATKEGSIEETALKTNLEAAEEVARQLRLRDLAGLIVIDFIDMDERKNNAAVEKRMKERLKSDRARIQVGRISGFGLMEMSRQRLRPGMLEATTQACPSCHGTGLIRSDDSMALSILRQIEEEGTRRRSREVLVKCPVAIANYLMNQKREHIAQIESRYGLSVRIEGDVHLVSPEFSLEKFKTATRAVPVATAPVVSVDATLMSNVDAEADAEVDEVEAPEETADGEARPKRRRRRRRRRKSGNGETREDADTADDNQDAAGEAVDSDDAEAPAEAQDTPEAEDAPKPKRSRSRSRSRKSAAADAEVAEGDAAAADPAEAPADPAPEAEVAAEPEAEEKPKPKRRTRSRKKKSDAGEAAGEPEAEVQPDPAPETVADAPEPDGTDSGAAAEVETADTAPEPVSEPEPEVAAATPPAEPTVTEAEPEVEAAVAVAEPEPEETARPKRRGWWSLGR